MHEVALAKSILQVVLEAAEGERVTSVRVQVGKLQTVVPDSLEFSFQLVAADTSAAGAALELEEIPARLRCRQCGAESDIDLPPFYCRQCAASDVEVISGDAVLVDAVELESGEIIGRRTVSADEILQEHIREHALHEGSDHAK